VPPEKTSEPLKHDHNIKVLVAEDINSTSFNKNPCWTLYGFSSDIVENGKKAIDMLKDK